MYGEDILYEISKAPFEILHQISFPHIKRWLFYQGMKI